MSSARITFGILRLARARSTSSIWIFFVAALRILSSSRAIAFGLANLRHSQVPGRPPSISSMTFATSGSVTSLRRSYPCQYASLDPDGLYGMPALRMALSLRPRAIP